MGIEIERKFLLVGDGWRSAAVRSQHMVQGYLARGGDVPCSIRVRIGEEGAWLNIKSAVAGVERTEFEYAIARADAEQMLARFCHGVVEKIRHYVPYAGHLFEIDEFLGDNAGLIVAELELAAVDAGFARPPWLGSEVSDRVRYYNLHLLDHPFARWSATERAGE
jgi:adenylate cyclase